MKHFTKTTVAMAAALATFAAAPAVAEYPEKPVQFVVPWPPGDMEDVLTRMIAEDFQAEYGVPAAVVNKPGGGKKRRPRKNRSTSTCGPMTCTVPIGRPLISGLTGSVDCICRSWKKWIVSSLGCST